MTPITLRETVETFLRLVRSEVLSTAVIVSSDDLFEVSKSPSLVLQGPIMHEDSVRRAMVTYCDIDRDAGTYEESLSPRMYHLDFEVIATGPKEIDVLTLQQSMSRFLADHPTFDVGDYGPLNLTEVTPLGGGRRVNLSNLRQATGMCRIEDFPVWSQDVYSGALIYSRIFDYRDSGNPDVTVDETINNELVLASGNGSLPEMTATANE